MSSLATPFLDALRFRAGDGSSLKALGECRGRQDLFRRQTPELLAALKDAAVIESTESSNRIEGVVAPHRRIEALVLKSAAPQDRSEQEIAGYRDALNLIHESARDMAFSVNVILQLHTLLYRYHAGQGGRWKAMRVIEPAKAPNAPARSASDGRPSLALRAGHGASVTAVDVARPA